MTRETQADRFRRYEGAAVLHAPAAGGSWRHERRGRVRAALVILAAVVALFWAVM